MSKRTRTRAEWIYKDGRLLCSNCNHIPVTRIEAQVPDKVFPAVLWDVTQANLHFCPICGAIMTNKSLEVWENGDKI